MASPYLNASSFASWVDVLSPKVLKKEADFVSNPVIFMGSSHQYLVHPALASEAGSRRRWQWRERSSRSIYKKHWKISTKRSASARSSKRPISGVKRRIRILKKLVPNGKSKGLEALFGEAADYVNRLQMKVHIMQVMVKLLSPCD